MSTTSHASARLPVEGRFPSLVGANTWLNSEPLTAKGLAGKVVLVDFWTYTCINWRRTMPWLRLWAEKYRAAGLVVIGVHTPEFSFEKNIDHVRRAAAELNVGYPIAVDSDFAVWNAFKNQYWPALYVIDAQGRIRHHQFGEGEYEHLESVIQQLLTEAGNTQFERDFVAAKGTGAEAAADWSNLQSPETYVGYERSPSLASDGARLDQARNYALPARLRLNEWAMAGNWTLGRESALLNAAAGKIVYRFRARDVHLVMGPNSPGHAIRFRVSIDGKPPGAAHGVDVDAEGNGTADQPRMYQLIRQAEPVAEREFAIEFLDPGAQLFVFTFG